MRFPRELKPDTFIVIASRCPAGSSWSPPALQDLLDEVIAKYPIDQDRLYLTGRSMGGWGSWIMAAAQWHYKTGQFDAIWKHTRHPLPITSGLSKPPPLDSEPCRFLVC